MGRPRITVRPSASVSTGEGKVFRRYQAAYVDPNDYTNNRTALGETYGAALGALYEILERDGYSLDDLPPPQRRPR